MRKLLYIFIFFPILSLPKDALSQQNEFDSLINALKSAHDDTNKVNLLYELSEQCEEKDIITYSKQGFDLAEKLNYKKGMADALNNLGYGYYHVGDISRSLDCYNRALKIDESLNNKLAIALVINNIGYTYEEQKDFTNALEYYKKSLAISREIKDTAGISVSINNIGVLYVKEHKSDSALTFYNESLRLRKLSKDLGGTAIILTNIGYIYLEKGDTAAAMNNFNENLGINQQLGYKRGLANTYNTLGVVYYSKKNYPEAEKFSRQSLLISQELGMPKIIEDASRQLSAIYGKMKRFEEAYNMNLLAQKMHDSIYNIEIKESTVKSKLQYEYEKKEAVAKAEQEKKDSTEAIIRNSLIIGFALVLVLAFVIFRGYRSKQKANVEISKQKLIIEEKNKGITDSITYAKRIQTSLLPTEKYIARNFNRLRKK